MLRFIPWGKAATDKQEGQTGLSESSPTAPRKIFPSGVKALHTPEDGVVDIVFVHGLTGDREKTWTGHGSSEPWPATLLPTKIPKARVLTFGYDAYVTSLNGVVAENRITDNAWNLLTALARYREEDDTNDRPILFVCHSLGGLVCEDALVTSKQRGERHLQQILHSTRGIIFLGTPHHGAALAKLAEWLARTVGLIKQTNSKILEVLTRDSEVLARIQGSFHTIAMTRRNEGLQPIEIICFYEEVPLPGVGLVVPKDSAILPGYIPIGIHSNHMDMTRFGTTDDPGFVAVCGELSRWVKEIDTERDQDSSQNKNPSDRDGSQDRRETSGAPDIQSLNPNIPADREVLYQHFLSSLPTGPVSEDDTHAAQGRLFSELMLWKFHAQGPWNFWLRDYIDQGCSVNIRDFDGQTPLHHALMSRYQREDKVRALVKAGADVTMRNFEDQTPVSLAKDVDESLFVFLLATWRKSLLTR